MQIKRGNCRWDSGLGSSVRFREICLFAAAAATNLRRTASIVPSFSRLVAAMVEPCANISPRVVVELGVGTGAVTRALLARMPVDSVIIGFEIDHRLARYACQRIRDHRLVVIPDSAETLPQVLNRLGLSHIDAAVSSLGLTGMEPRLRRKIIGSVAGNMRLGGIFTQFQYVYSRFGSVDLSPPKFRRFDERDFLRKFFTDVEQRWIGWNFPPAFVFTCRK